jgi:hypothetical protein
MMKKIIGSLILMLFIVSCEKLEDTQPQDQNKKEAFALSKARVATGPVGTLVSGSRTTYEPWPRQGRPNETEYLFQIHDIVYPDKPLSVKFTNLTGYEVIEPMSYDVINKLWILRRKLSSQGRVKVEYVYTSSGYQVYQSPDYWVDNTLVQELSPGQYSLYWPFGADGSNYYTNRNGWHGPMEGVIANCQGLGWNQGKTHKYLGCKADDHLAEDWNNCDHNDDDEWFVSPVDGKVVYAGKQNTVAMRDFGYRVDIVQELGNKKLMFRIAHLQNGSIPTSLVVGSQVLGGVTYLGKIGGTGQTDNSYNPHAHCVLYELDLDNCTTGKIFLFGAQ